MSLQMENKAFFPYWKEISIQHCIVSHFLYHLSAARNLELIPVDSRHEVGYNLDRVLVHDRAKKPEYPEETHAGARKPM